MSRNFEVLQKLEENLDSSVNGRMQEKTEQNRITASKFAENEQKTPEIPEESPSKNLETTPSADSEESLGKKKGEESFCPIADSQVINIDVKQMAPSILPLIDEQSIVLEQYRSLRTKVFAKAKLPDKNAIMITSSAPGEGKTITAINLALTIVKGIKENALLVDCDLRRPDIHKKLGFTTQYGLSHYLNNEVGLSSIIYRTNIEKLSIIPAGENLTLSSELLASKRMTKLVEETKSRYNDRYIIFDMPPVIPVTDPIVLVEKMDWTIFVIEIGHTAQSVVRNALSMFNPDKIMGIVVNNIDFMPSGYGYHYKKAGYGPK